MKLSNLFDVVGDFRKAAVYMGKMFRPKKNVIFALRAIADWHLVAFGIMKRGQRCFTGGTERLQVAVPVNSKHKKQPVALLLRRAALVGFLLFLLIAPLVTKAAPVAQVQEEALAENQAAAETDADAEKKAEHWRRKIGGEEFINVHVAYSFCLAFAGGVVFGFAVWCVPNIIVLHLDFKNRNRWGR